ncbi:MAG: D-lyxose/D-mannose family sugar isomerase, partial [Clostridia bacterium]|nr:D-lyxose/D-mannose family sugar isomerase [Clostridia bacterium]
MLISKKGIIQSVKRSEINAALRELEAICQREHCYLPPFCNFTPDE